jgi:UDP-N-acetylglucosamine 2-epimerase (non-hydrolysing)
MVGNVMIDSFEFLKDKIEGKRAWEMQKLKEKSYAVVTFHRPANVDNPESLTEIVNELNRISLNTPLVFPVHPRTEAKLRAFGLMEKLDSQRITICGPLDYENFISLVMGSKLVITDSGGIQEETTYLGIPCLTLRENTERPITISIGTNKLVNILDLGRMVDETLDNPIAEYQVPKFWDGNTAHRIAEHLKAYFSNTSGTRNLIW